MRRFSGEVDFENVFKNTSGNLIGLLKYSIHLYKILIIFLKIKVVFITWVFDRYQSRLIFIHFFKYIDLLVFLFNGQIISSTFEFTNNV